MEVSLAKRHEAAGSLFAPSTTVSIRARMGRTVHDRSCTRKKSRKPVMEKHLPAVRAYPVGRAMYCSGFRHALFNDERVFADHSLVASLHPERAMEIGAAQVALIAEGRSQRPAPRSIAGDVHITCNEGSGTWGHWLIHNLPRALMFLDAYPDGRLLVPRGYRGGRYGACGEILSLMGVSEAQIEFVERNELVEVENAVVVDLPYSGGLPHPAVLERFKDIGPLDGPVDQGTGPVARLFIDRTVATREIANREELQSTLRQNDVRGVQLGDAKMSEQISVWQSAKCVSGVLGSDLTNMVFGDSVQLLILTPEWFGDSFFYGLAAMKGMEWNELFCGELIERRTPEHKSSFRVDPTAYERLLRSMEGD